MSIDHNLVQCGENVQNKPSFICNCCKCHCQAFMAARKFGLLVPMNTTNYIPIIDESKCVGCGKCTLACPMTAIAEKYVPVALPKKLSRIIFKKSNCVKLPIKIKKPANVNKRE